MGSFWAQRAAQRPRREDEDRSGSSALSSLPCTPCRPRVAPVSNRLFIGLFHRGGTKIAPEAKINMKISTWGLPWGGAKSWRARRRRRVEWKTGDNRHLPAGGFHGGGSGSGSKQADSARMCCCSRLQRQECENDPGFVLLGPGLVASTFPSDAARGFHILRRSDAQQLHCGW